MTVDKEDIRRRVEALKSVPTLPGVLEKITESVDSSETAAADIASIISSDQALSAKVLRLVNSAFYGFPGRISNVTHALIILGFDVVKGIVLSTSVFDMMLAKGLFGLWEHSLGCAVAAGVIAGRIEHPDPEEVSIAALLHDLGKVIIRIELPEESSLIEEAVEKKGISVYEAEEDILGLNHATVGKWLSTKWNLPRTLGDPIAYHHAPGLAELAPKQTAIVHLADILIRARGFGSGGDNLVHQIDPKAWGELNISDALLEEIINEMDDKLEDAEDFLGDDVRVQV
ncbi:MAG: HDOD domain-containing protein [Desulfobacterales bacterium]|nr:HDOD domain-containing protein [Desulfobacterales bacterium]